jgi:hypothetical protein
MKGEQMNSPAIIHRGKADLAEWRALQIESRLLAEVYEPIWYHYHVALDNGGDIAVYLFGNDDRVELLDSTADKDIADGKRGEMSQMAAEFWCNHEIYRVGIKQREPGESYAIGIDCRNQWGEHHSIYSALIHSTSIYTEIMAVVDRLVGITADICGDKAEAQWLTLPKAGNTE